MLEGFCEYLRRQGKSENTVKAYCQGMKEYMRWHEETFGKRMKLFCIFPVEPIIIWNPVYLTNPIRKRNLLLIRRRTTR